MTKQILCPLWAGLAFLPAAYAQPQPLEEIVVTASLRAETQLEAPTSLTVLGAEAIAQSGEQHFEELMPLVPNLNWSAGSSRPRYFQIRGIGERSQYQGAPNPSVGFVVDDIDFSGIGTIATLWDIERIEVIEGPVSTAYGHTSPCRPLWRRFRFRSRPSRRCALLIFKGIKVFRTTRSIPSPRIATASCGSAPPTV